MSRIAIAMIIVWGAACHVPPAIPALPEHGGPRWVEVTSAHFTIWTDSPERGRSLVETMERLREVIFGTALFGRRDEGYRVFVIALANKQEVGAYLPEQFIAYASSGGPLFQPVIVLAADALDTRETRRILTHELTHVISYGPLPIQPHWFSEALATFYETVEVDGTRVDLGKPTEGRGAELRHERPMPLPQLFACKVDACMTANFYATAWALFTFLATEHPKELFELMNFMSVTDEHGQDGLWAKAIPSLASMDVAEHEFHAWIAHGRVLVRQYTVKHATWTSTERPLGDADALAARGVAKYTYGHGPLPDDITAALALDPNHVVARMLESHVSQHIPLDAARAVTVAHPDDWRAWFLLRRAAGLTGEGHEAHDAYDKMCELVAKNSVAMPAGFCGP